MITSHDILSLKHKNFGHHVIRESFCESGEISGFPERGADLWGLPGKSGELLGKSGKLPGNLWIAVKVQSERTSGEVAGELPGKFGNFRGSPGLFIPLQARGLVYEAASALKMGMRARAQAAQKASPEERHTQ